MATSDGNTDIALLVVLFYLLSITQKSQFLRRSSLNIYISPLCDIGEGILP